MKETQLPFSTETYIQRRKKLMELMGGGKILLLGNGYSSINFEDNSYPYRQDSSILYYCGLSKAGLNLLIDADKGETILFGDDASLDHLIWMGDQEKLADMAAKAGINKVMPSLNIFDHVDSTCHYLPPYRSAHTIKLEQYLDITEIKPSVKLIMAISKQRNIKSDEEIKCMHEAASLTAAMHKEVMIHAREGMNEFELVSLASQFAWDHNMRWSFTPIMTTQGQTLHNHNYNGQLHAGDLLLFDGGIEHPSGYAGDMTRTFPVNSSFSTKQRDIYNIVVKAHDAAVEASKADVYYKDIHLMASQIIAEGLTELGLMKADPEDAVMEGAHSLFFPHGLGHLIGLDVHDMENLGEDFVGYDHTIRKSREFGLKSLRLGRPLQKGFAITIEPGIYFIPQLFEKWRAEKMHEEFINYDAVASYMDFGGIRVENDYIIGSNGAQLLGEKLAYDADSVEQARS